MKVQSVSSGSPEFHIPAPPLLVTLEIMKMDELNAKVQFASFGLPPSFNSPAPDPLAQDDVWALPPVIVNPSKIAPSTSLAIITWQLLSV